MLRLTAPACLLEAVLATVSRTDHAACVQILSLMRVNLEAGDGLAALQSAAGDLALVLPMLLAAMSAEAHEQRSAAVCSLAALPKVRHMAESRQPQRPPGCTCGPIAAFSPTPWWLTVYAPCPLPSRGGALDHGPGSSAAPQVMLGRALQDALSQHGAQADAMLKGQPLSAGHLEELTASLQAHAADVAGSPGAATSLLHGWLARPLPTPASKGTPGKKPRCVAGGWQRPGQRCGRSIRQAADACRHGSRGCRQRPGPAIQQGGRGCCAAGCSGWRGS